MRKLHFFAYTNLEARKNDLKLHLFWNKDSLSVEIHATVISGGVECKLWVMIWFQATRRATKLSLLVISILSDKWIW